jgi:hypothetical protein
LSTTLEEDFTNTDAKHYICPAKVRGLASEMWLKTLISLEDDYGNK